MTPGSHWVLDLCGEDGGDCRCERTKSLSQKQENRQRASKRANDAIDLSVSEEAASICVECALSPVDRHSAFKCGLAQRGASFC